MKRLAAPAPLIPLVALALLAGCIEELPDGKITDKFVSYEGMNAKRDHSGCEDGKTCEKVYNLCTSKCEDVPQEAFNAYNKGDKFTQDDWKTREAGKGPNVDFVRHISAEWSAPVGSAVKTKGYKVCWKASDGQQGCAHSDGRNWGGDITIKGDVHPKWIEVSVDPDDDDGQVVCSISHGIHGDASGDEKHNCRVDAK